MIEVYFETGFCFGSKHEWDHRHVVTDLGALAQFTQTEFMRGRTKQARSTDLWTITLTRLCDPLPNLSCFIIFEDVLRVTKGYMLHSVMHWENIYFEHFVLNQFCSIDP